MKKILLLYIPVLHRGYMKLFEKYAEEVSCLYVMGSNFSKELAYFEEEIRAIDPETIKIMIESLNIFKSVKVLDHHNLGELKGSKIITAKEGVIHRFVAKYFTGGSVVYDTIFLRWDEERVLTQKPVSHDTVSKKEFDRKMIALASQEGSKTSDWWREVGAIVVKDGRVILTAHNEHIPSEHTPYALGDIRDFIEPGKHSHISSALHSENGVIIQAARSVLEGASIYVNVFPCPTCAKAIAYSGIKKCYFSGGHASFDGEDILKQQSVEIIFVEKE